MKTIEKIMGVIALVILFNACNKNPGGTGAMTVKMKDAPVEYDSVFVDVQRVDVHFSDNNTGSSGWVALNTQAGVYDLLALQNGLFAILADSVELPVGNISQMRLILGTENSVVVGGISFPLLLSSQDKTGLKFNLNTTISDDDLVEVLIDFDAEKSIVLQGTGEYRLKPVIKVESVVII